MRVFTTREKREEIGGREWFIQIELHHGGRFNLLTISPVPPIPKLWRADETAKGIRKLGAN